MYRNLHTKFSSVLGFQVGGPLNETEVESIIVQLGTAIAIWEKIRLFVNVIHVEGAAPNSVLTSLHFLNRFSPQIEKLAVVGDGDWAEWWNEFSRKLSHTELNYFDRIET